MRSFKPFQTNNMLYECFYTVKVRKICGYRDYWKIVITPIVHHHLLFSFSVQTAYCETGVSNHSNSFMKIIYTGAYMILDAQNLHTFSQSQVCNLVSFRHHSLVWSCADHVKIVLCSIMSFGYRSIRASVSLND